MIISKELEQKITVYEQAYFQTDDPVPFKGGLKVYPVMARDYYKFYSTLGCLTQDKTVKKVKYVDENGIEKEKEVANPEGIAMSYMNYLIKQMEDEKIGGFVTSQVIRIFELCLHEKNRLYCPKCGKKIEDEEIAKKLIELDKEIANLGEDISDEDRQLKRLQMLQSLSVCECGEQMREVYGIKNENGQKNLMIKNIVLTNKDLEELTAIITHYNILDYDGDKYIDPNLKKDLELKRQLEHKDYASPSLEKQMVGVSISSPYRIEELKEKVTLRKLALMLKMIDSQRTYYAQIQGQMSGMVEFKTPPLHWMYGNDKKDMSKEIMSLNDVQSKFAAVT